MSPSHGHPALLPAPQHPGLGLPLPAHLPCLYAVCQVGSGHPAVSCTPPLPFTMQVTQDPYLTPRPRDLALADL